MTTAIVKTHYQDPAVAGAYDRQRFTGWVGRLFDFLEKRAIRRLLRTPLRQKPDLSMLDLPCGTGRITELLLELGTHVTAGDISAEMMEVARARLGDRYPHLQLRRLDLDRLDLPDRSFDLVTCVRLFHHLDSPSRRRVLSELARASRRYVLVNVSLSTFFYRLRRRLKRLLGQGVSRESSTPQNILEEARAAGLVLRDSAFAARWLSEDLVLLLERADGQDGQRPR
jgi:ubiquinone/menaquinone biosynthesis C-methylase UbiE